VKVARPRRAGVWAVDPVLIGAISTRDAFLRFGKGRHKASLNFGDCMSYALAKSRNAKLLYKGTDFAATDVATA
jgi:ribonuclease VapC